MADNIYSKIMSIRKDFTETKITKSGHNKYQDFRYLQLEDFVPLATELCCKYGLYTHINIGTQLSHSDTDYYATMTVLNIDNTDEKVMYQLKIPNLDLFKGNNVRQTIQDAGSLETYARRYLYMLFLDLTASDEIDEDRNNTKTGRKPTLKELNQRKKLRQQQEESTKVQAEQVEPRHRPRDANNDLQNTVKDPEPLKTMCNQIIAQLEKEGKEISKANMRVKATMAKRDGRLDAETHHNLIAYIDKHCPEEASN